MSSRSALSPLRSTIAPSSSANLHSNSAPRTFSKLGSAKFKSQRSLRISSKQKNEDTTTDDNSATQKSAGELGTSQELPAVREKEKKDKSNKVIYDKCTILNFKFVDGSKNDVILLHQPQTYADLQREICKIYPNTKKMLVIQDIEGNFVYANSFTPSASFVLKEYHSLRVPSLIPDVPITWEFRGYHAAPEVWESFTERKQRLALEKAEEELRKRNEEESFERKLIANNEARAKRIQTSESPSPPRTASPSSRMASRGSNDGSGLDLLEGGRGKRSSVQRRLKKKYST